MNPHPEEARSAVSKDFILRSDRRSRLEGRRVLVSRGQKYYLAKLRYYFFRRPAMATTVTVKGQVTIPKRVRDHLGIVPGSAVEFDLNKDGHVVLLKAKGKGQGKGPGKAGAKKPPKSRFARLLGTATVRMTTDELMALTRGDD